MSYALAGHELCSTQAQRFGPSNPVSPTMATAEWARMLIPDGGQAQAESLHPNAFAQQGLGICLGTVYNWTTSGDYGCYGQAHLGASGMYLWPN